MANTAISALPAASSLGTDDVLVVNDSGVTKQATISLLHTMSWSAGANVSSDSTINLTAASGSAVHVTGTTTITAVTLGSGIWKLVVFDGALTLTHHATNNNLPGGANITTAANDRALYWSDGTTVYCMAYMPASGRAVRGFVLGTEQATTSGTTIDFTGIPAGTKKITLSFVGVSTNGTSDLLVQLGDAGGIEASTYTSVSIRTDTTGSAEATSTSGFAIAFPSASDVLRGTMTLTLEDSSDFTWVSGHTCCHTGGAANRSVTGAGSKALSAELTQVRLTSVSGDTFDAGAMNILYEG